MHDVFMIKKYIYDSLNLLQALYSYIVNHSLLFITNCHAFLGHGNISKQLFVLLSRGNSAEYAFILLLT